MTITALAPWFGGKRTLAPEIIAELGPHRVYWEPFCGSMAVLLAKPPASMETVNDLHGDLINLARTIRHQRAGAQLYRRLRRTLLHQDIHAEAKANIGDTAHEVVTFDTGHVEHCDVQRAYDYFLLSWLGRNGMSGSASHNHTWCTRYTANGGHGAKRFAAAVDSIPAWRERMRQVTILRTDAFALLERIEDAPGTAIYCDPPYIVKGSKYVHDFGNGDHQRLAELLRRFRHTRVVVSYYAHPLLAQLYPQWTRREIEVSKALAHQGARTASDARATEVLLLNGPSLAAPAPAPAQGLFT